jgi:hypothetical protein
LHVSAQQKYESQMLDLHLFLHTDLIGVYIPKKDGEPLPILKKAHTPTAEQEMGVERIVQDLSDMRSVYRMTWARCSRAACMHPSDFHNPVTIPISLISLEIDTKSLQTTTLQNLNKKCARERRILCSTCPVVPFPVFNSNGMIVLECPSLT